MRLTVISCGAKKRHTPCQAKNMYIGGYFQKQLQWALSVSPPDRIRILSAKYGLIPLTKRIAPYEQRMGESGSVTVEQIADQLPYGTEIVTSAGDAYLKALTSAAKTKACTIRAPFQGRGRMGSKMAAMKKITQVNKR